MKVPVGLLVFLSAILAGCAGADPSPAGNDSSVEGGAVLTADVAAELSAAAAAHACSPCSTGTVYVRDRLLSSVTLQGEDEPMPEALRERLADVFENVRFVDRAEELEVLGDDLLPDSGTVVYFGPIQELATDVLGIEIGVISERGGFLAQTVQFKWNGESWQLATSDDTGVTVTTSVS